MGDAHGGRVPRVEVHLHVDACERLRHAPGDLDAHLLGVRKDAGLLIHKVERFQPEPLTGAAGHAGNIGQIVVDHIHIGRVHIDGNGLLHISVKDDLALVQHDTAAAELADGGHIVADIQHRAAVLIGDIAHLAKAFLLELHIADRQHLVHDHDLAVEVGGHGKGQLDKHTAGIALDRRVDKFDDLRQLGIDLGLSHAEDRAVHIDILAAGHFIVEAGADLQHRGHAAANFDLALGGGRDAGQQL